MKDVIYGGIKGRLAEKEKDQLKLKRLPNASMQNDNTPNSKALNGKSNKSKTFSKHKTNSKTPPKSPSNSNSFNSNSNSSPNSKPPSASASLSASNTNTNTNTNKNSKPSKSSKITTKSSNSKPPSNSKASSSKAGSNSKVNKEVKEGERNTHWFEGRKKRLDKLDKSKRNRNRNKRVEEYMANNNGFFKQITELQEENHDSDTQQNPSNQPLAYKHNHQRNRNRNVYRNPNLNVGGSNNSINPRKESGEADADIQRVMSMADEGGFDNTLFFANIVKEEKKGSEHSNYSAAFPEHEDDVLNHKHGNNTNSAPANGAFLAVPNDKKDPHRYSFGVEGKESNNSKKNPFNHNKNNS